MVISKNIAYASKGNSICGIVRCEVLDISYGRVKFEVSRIFMKTQITSFRIEKFFRCFGYYDSWMNGVNDEQLRNEYGGIIFNMDKKPQNV